MEVNMIRALGICFLIISSNSYGWGELGHGATAYIAEKFLSPNAKGFVHDILGQQPMGLASIFPDQVRDDPRFNPYNPYHFFEIPYQYNYETLPKENRAPQSADTLITMGPNLLTTKKNKLSVTQKQIIFKYYLHIMGDIHQPLHIGNGTDRGANLCDVNFPDAGTGKKSRLNLHQIWDDDLVLYIRKKIMDDAAAANAPIRYFSYRHLGDSILAEFAATGELEKIKKQANETTLSQWYQESRDLHEFVYPPADKINGLFPYCKTVQPETGKITNGSYDRSKIPDIDSSYINQSTQIIKKQILLGAFRLLNEIEKMAKTSKSKPFSNDSEVKYFQKILPKLDLRPRAPSSDKLKNKKISGEKK
jgi:hypothetical protein